MGQGSSWAHQHQAPTGPPQLSRRSGPKARLMAPYQHHVCSLAFNLTSHSMVRIQRLGMLQSIVTPSTACPQLLWLLCITYQTSIRLLHRQPCTCAT